MLVKSNIMDTKDAKLLKCDVPGATGPQGKKTNVGIIINPNFKSVTASTLIACIVSVQENMQYGHTKPEGPYGDRWSNLYIWVVHG